MSETPNPIIPLAYHHKALAVLLLVCGVGFILCVAGQAWFTLVLFNEGEREAWRPALLAGQAIGCVAFGAYILTAWRVLRGKPTLWIEGGSLIMSYLGTRRIPLSQIVSVEFDRFASGYDPVFVTLHIRDAKPWKIWLHRLRPVSGFADVLRKATSGEALAT